ncbi:VASCULAR ASSOCIATED DEATH 1, chloroplastic-like protein [Drosera capensis]
MAVAPPSPSSAGATTAPASQSMDPQPSLKQQQPPSPRPQQSDTASLVTSSPDLSSRFSRSPGSNRDYESLVRCGIDVGIVCALMRRLDFGDLRLLSCGLSCDRSVWCKILVCELHDIKKRRIPTTISSPPEEGHMYLFDHYLCFYANIFGFETKKIINEVANVRRAKTAGIFPNAIEIFASGEKLFFASFLSRDEAFKLIAERWSLYGEGAKGISDEQDSKSESGSYLNGVNPLEDGNDELPASDLDSGESHLVIRTSQEVNDVPYADYFHVEGCWDVCRDGDQSRESCILRVYVTVVFTKKTMFKGKIEQSTLDECREACATWISLAHQLLRQKNIEKGQASVHKNETIRSESEGKVTEASARPCQRVEHRPIVNTGADCSGSTQQSETDTMLLNTSDLASLFKISRTKFCSFFKSRGNLQVLLVATFVLILLLMQLSIVVLLTRPQPVHVSPQADHMATTGVVGSQSKGIATALLEKRILLLKDEMLLVEAHLERLKNEQMLSKAQMQDLEYLVREM